MDTSKKIKMTVTMDVTIPQGLALQSMFNHWNRLAGMGASREVAFYADGDGNFHPKAECEFSEEVPELTSEMEEIACNTRSGHDRFGRTLKLFDFDGLAWKLRDSK